MIPLLLFHVVPTFSHLSTLTHHTYAPHLCTYRHIVADFGKSNVDLDLHRAQQKLGAAIAVATPTSAACWWPWNYCIVPDPPWALRAKSCQVRRRRTRTRTAAGTAATVTAAGRTTPCMWALPEDRTLPSLVPAVAAVSKASSSKSFSVGFRCKLGGAPIKHK